MAKLAHIPPPPSNVVVAVAQLPIFPVSSRTSLSADSVDYSADCRISPSVNGVRCGAMLSALRSELTITVVRSRADRLPRAAKAAAIGACAVVIVAGIEAVELVWPGHGWRYWPRWGALLATIYWPVSWVVLRRRYGGERVARERAAQRRAGAKYYRWLFVYFLPVIAAMFLVLSWIDVVRVGVPRMVAELPERLHCARRIARGDATGVVTSSSMVTTGATATECYFTTTCQPGLGPARP